MIAKQLTIDGGEVEHETVTRQSHGLTGAQRMILTLALEQGHISPAVAGRVVHDHRTPPCARCSEGSCAFTSTDGADALKRLVNRGFLRKLSPGVYQPR